MTISIQLYLVDYVIGMQFVLVMLLAMKYVHVKAATKAMEDYHVEVSAMTAFNNYKQ